MKRLYHLALRYTLRTSLAARVETMVEFLVDEWIKANP